MKIRLVDRIESWEPHRRMRGVKALSFEEACLKEPFGEEGRLPGSLLLGSLLELANWLVLASTEFTRAGVVGSLADVRFPGKLGLGQRAWLEVSVTRLAAERMTFAGSAAVEGRLVLSVSRILAFTVPAADYFDPESARVLFGEIGGLPGGRAT